MARLRTSRSSQLRRFILGYLHAVAVGAVIVGAASTSPTTNQRIRAATADSGWTFVYYVVISGFLSMALIELVKRLTNVRGRFQRAEIARFLYWRGQSAADLDAEYKGAERNGSAVDARVAAGQLETLLGGSRTPSSIYRGPWFLQPIRTASWSLTADNTLAIYSEPIEQVCGQIAISMEVALSEPRRYMPLLVGVTGLPSGLLLRLFRSALPEGESDQSVRRWQGELVLTQSMRAGIDLLQVSVGRRWRWNVRMAALWVSGATGLLLLHVANLQLARPRDFVISAMTFGAFFAWFSRDIVAVVERKRRQ